MNALLLKVAERFDVRIGSEAEDSDEFNNY